MITADPSSPRNHIQIKGDPSIRQQLFMQTRTISTMEQQIDQINRLVERMVLEQGVFHILLRYSRSTATIRLNNHPYHDQLLTMEQLIAPEFSSSLNKQPFSSMATISRKQIMPVLELFKSLRLADENAYLRSGSLNIITGMVELNFSCDGTHYLPVTEFLEKSISFWLNDSNSHYTTRINQLPITQPHPSGHFVNYEPSDAQPQPSVAV